MKPDHLNRFLPGTGRGTARRVVEGAHGDVCALADRRDPSVGWPLADFVSRHSLQGGLPPATHQAALVPGRIRIAPLHVKHYNDLIM
jgi:hypothetical protein